MSEYGRNYFCALIIIVCEADGAMTMRLAVDGVACKQPASCTADYCSSRWMGEAELFSWIAMISRYFHSKLEHAALFTVGNDGRIVNGICF